MIKFGPESHEGNKYAVQLKGIFCILLSQAGLSAKKFEL